MFRWSVAVFAGVVGLVAIASFVNKRHAHEAPGFRPSLSPEEFKAIFATPQATTQPEAKR